jgi:capsular polysaccharide biosynthesis protein
MKNCFQNFEPNNKKIIRLFIIFLTFIIIPTSCTFFYSKDNYIKDFSIFIQDVKTKSPTYTEKDWADADLQFENFTVKQYEQFKTELSENDKETIGKLKGSYYVYKFKKETKDAIEQTKDLIYQAKGVLEEAIDTLKK